MCKYNPTVLIYRAGVLTPQTVNCKSCSECIVARKNDFLGRCLCESAVSDHTLAVTLTYRNDPGGDGRMDGAELNITKEHFQDWIRAIRSSTKKTNKIRYICVSEVGSLKGRVHFHCLLFIKGPMPQQFKRYHAPKPLIFKKRVDQWLWPHGFCYIDDVGTDHRAINYVCKYISKDMCDANWLTLSKKPALGSEVIQSIARRNVKLGVFPKSLSYTPPGGQKNRTYPLSGATRRDFIATIKNGLPKYTRGRFLNTREDEDWVLKSIHSVERYEARRAIVLHQREQLATLGKKKRLANELRLFKDELDARSHSGFDCHVKTEKEKLNGPGWFLPPSHFAANKNKTPNRQHQSGFVLKTDKPSQSARKKRPEEFRAYLDYQEAEPNSGCRRTRATAEWLRSRPRL